MQKNRLPAVAQVLEAIPLASSTGKFETLGSNFSQETRRGYWRPPLQLGKSYKIISLHFLKQLQVGIKQI